MRAPTGCGRFAWVKPEVAVQIDYTEWTEANHLRHSFFRGISDETYAKNVVKSQ